MTTPSYSRSQVEDIHFLKMLMDNNKKSSQYNTDPVAIFIYNYLKFRQEISRNMSWYSKE